MSARPRPSEENQFLYRHVAVLRNSLRHWTGRTLTPPGMNDFEAARYLFTAPFALASHDASSDPVFDYGNRTALSLFGMDWEQFTALPSRMSTEPGEDRSERERLLAEVAEHGFIDNYSGVRIGRHGRRFQIENVTVWNLIDPDRGAKIGQAAMIKNWKFL